MSLSTVAHTTVCATSDGTADSRLIDAVVQSVKRNDLRKQAQVEKQNLMLEKNKHGDLYGWLKEEQSKGGAAWPTMQAIRQAEKICGRRLCVSLPHGLVLTGKGFRLVAPGRPSDFAFLVAPGANVQRITKSRVRHRLDARYAQADVKLGIRNSVSCPEIKSALLYMGVDEWSLHRKVLWGTMTGLTFSLGCVLSFPHFFIHRRDYELALRPVLVAH